MFATVAVCRMCLAGGVKRLTCRNNALQSDAHRPLLYE